MGSTADVQIQGIKNLLLRSNWYLGAVKVYTLLCLLALDTLEFLLISSPLVCDELATFETPDRDNHSAT